MNKKYGKWIIIALIIVVFYTLVFLDVSKGIKDEKPEPVYKPVIYLYPDKKTDVDVSLEFSDGSISVSYPEYENGWHVTANPDGSLEDNNGRTYNYLYYEAQVNTDWDFSTGFCVKGTDTAAFLEEKLEMLGLTRNEANEFIVYWLPILQENPYNLISFQTDAYENTTKLNVTPKPDSVIRINMAVRPLDHYVSISKQEIITPARNGFTVVEWGGSYSTS